MSTSGDRTHDLAVEVCARSGEHTAGRGRHDAYRFGPCSDHERVVSETVATLTQMGVAVATPQSVVLPNDTCALCGGGFGSQQDAWDHVRHAHPDHADHPDGAPMTETTTPPLTTEQRARMCLVMLGSIEALHTNLDALREGHDPRNPLDHNVEQAQIALENASMRVQQVLAIIERSDASTEGAAG